MHSKIENNVLGENDVQQSDYKYNFFDTPWDDRSQKSKACIIALLSGIFIATMALITHNLIIFYSGFDDSSIHRSNEINCNVVKVDKHRYAARIHSIITQELICIGALVTANSVLASAVCLKSGSIRLYLGSLSNHRCKKGFPVKSIELIHHDGVITNNLVLLLTWENMLDCGKAVRLGLRINMKRQAFVIGRPYRGGRSLSFQPVTMAPIDNCTRIMGLSINNLNKDNLICVKYLPSCPVRAGDLLVQRERLIGIASMSTHMGKNNDMACFANLSLIYSELKQLDSEIDFS